jgi:hypothetical protein
MVSVAWGLALVAAVVWPGRSIGPLDGAPIDTTLELVVLAVALPAVWWLYPSFLQTVAARTLVALLLVWKIAAWTMLPQGGWCVDLLVKQPAAIGGWRLTRSWDAHVFGEPSPASCSAIMTHPYARGPMYPGWTINIPYGRDRWLHSDLYTAHVSGDYLAQPEPTPRPPDGEYRLLVHGAFDATAAGTLRLAAGHDVAISGDVDGATVSVPPGGGDTDIALRGGAHHLDLQLDLAARDWRFDPTWNGADIFAATTTSTNPMSGAAVLVHRVTRWAIPLLVAAMLILWIRAAFSFYAIDRATVIAVCAACTATASAVALIDNATLARLSVLVLLASVAVPISERLRNVRGVWVIVGAPWLALIAAMASWQVGRFTLYQIGDDPLFYQLFAHRVFFEGYWLEAGQKTFWNQPLYRWICGALHLAFGDSSAGEVIWDGFGLLIGAMFAALVVHRVAGFRASLAAAAAVLVTFVLGPNWYLIGRGLTEISAVAWIYLASCCLVGAAGGSLRLAALGGVFAVLGYYTRMNHLPLVLALGALTLAESLDARAIRNLRLVWKRVPKRVVVTYYAVLALGLCAFAARTWYYTGQFSLTAGTQIGHLSIGLGTSPESWLSADAWRRAADSILMIVTVQDPPRFDWRSLLVVMGFAAAVLGLLQMPLARRLPLGIALVCVASVAGGLVARGTAYPGRFSLHLIPVAVAVSMVFVNDSVLDRTPWRRAS